MPYDDDKQRVAIRLDIEIAVDGIGTTDDVVELGSGVAELGNRQGEAMIDAHTVGQVFAHMLKDSVLWQSFALVPEGDATPRVLVVREIALLFPCSICGWHGSCPTNVGQDCHS